MKNVFMKLFAVFAAMAFVVFAAGCGGGKSASSGSGSAQTAQTTQQKPPKQDGKQDKKDDAGKTDKKSSYTMSDIKKLKNTDNFSRHGLEHIFDGTINKKGKATGYHYSRVEDSKGQIIDGTRGKKDENGVFTAKVEVDGVKKEGFSSFYPEDWSPQEVVDAINTAYKDALADKQNPRGSLWIGHAGKLEIDMYLDDNRKILTAYPIHRGKK
jgi:hypothetical protein